MVPSKVDRSVKIMPLTVKNVFDLAVKDFDVENPIQVINTLVVQYSSLVGVQNNIVGKLFLDILELSDLEFSEETAINLKKISSIASTYPMIFSDNNDQPDLKEEIKILYKAVVDDIQPDLKKMFKDKFKLFTKTSIQPSELDKLPYWEYKQYLKFL